LHPGPTIRRLPGQREGGTGTTDFTLANILKASGGADPAPPGALHSTLGPIATIVGGSAIATWKSSGRFHPVNILLRRLASAITTCRKSNGRSGKARLLKIGDARHRQGCNGGEKWEHRF
jgi:hypothetical protein